MEQEPIQVEEKIEEEQMFMYLLEVSNEEDYIDKAVIIAKNAQDALGKWMIKQVPINTENMLIEVTKTKVIQ